MNPTIIVLGALILIVIVIIVVILIKGKDDGEKEGSKVENSTMTFQQGDNSTQGQASVEPDLVTPQLHEKKEGVVEVNPNPPVQPTNPPTPKGQPSIQETLQQPKQGNQNVYKPNPLPTNPQIKDDMVKLQKSETISSPPPVIQKQAGQGVNRSPLPVTNPDDSPDQLQHLKNNLNNTLNTQKPRQTNQPIPPLGQTPIEESTTTGIGQNPQPNHENTNSLIPQQQTPIPQQSPNPVNP